jgi:hypothetical protein
MYGREEECTQSFRRIVSWKESVGRLRRRHEGNIKMDLTSGRMEM